MTIQEALDRFLVQLEADGRSPHTVGQYRRHVQSLARWLSETGQAGEVGDLNHELIARFLSSPAAKACEGGGAKKATSVNALRSSIRVFAAYLHQAGYVAQDPGRLIKRAQTSSGPPRALSAEERDRLLLVLGAAAGDEAARDHALIDLMAMTGIRLSAALGLDVEDLNLAGGDLTIRTKGDRTERVYLPRPVAEHLARFVGKRTTGPVFTARGQRVSRRHVQRRFSEWLKRAGISQTLSPHSLRHSMAMDLYRKTGDILLVKEALHHRSIASTIVYARASQENLRAALA